MMKRLLVLDRESSVVKLLRHVLKEYALIEATTAEQALRSFINHGRKIDLLLVDLTLPTISGIQVALLLRSEIPNLPVILTSGYAVRDWSEQDSGDLDRIGSTSVAILQKPFQPQVLLNSVCELIGAPSPGNDLIEEIETTEKAILSPFNVWVAPGVRINGVPNTQTSFITWSRGVVPEPPKGLQQYKISFHARHSDERVVHVVSYVYDPASKEGYVYIPATDLSMSTVGIEGNWLYASAEFDKVIEPVIRKASGVLPSSH
jgi:CheY-like chemotaxis protein